jgi:hypothetical protein
LDTVVEVRIAEKVVEVKPLVVAVDVSIEDVWGEFVVVGWVFAGVVPDAKLFVVEITVASVDPWEECAVELFGNVADVGVADKNIYIKFLSVTDISTTVLLETSAALVVFEWIVVVGAVAGVEVAAVDSSDDLMEVVSNVGWFITDVGV